MPIEPIITRRPSPSQHDAEDENDPLVAVGKVIASQARIERQWQAVKVEHETYTSTVTQLARHVEELDEKIDRLLASSKGTRRSVTHLQVLMPAVLVALEILRSVVGVHVP